MKTYRIQIILLIVFAPIFIMASCEDEMIGKEIPNTPVNNFEYFWKTLDTHYGMFEVKNIDWSRVHSDFAPRITNESTDTDLYKVLTEMTTLLNDNHMNLYPTNGALPVFPGGVLSYRDEKLTILKAQADYDLEVCKKYITNYQQVTPNIGFGKLSDDVAYINLKGTDDLKAIETHMTKIISAISTSKKIVVDVRGFYGGYDPASQALAGYFASSEKLYMKTKKRNGPLHADFTPVSDWYVTPQAPTYTKPVILLTSRFTQSAGETLALALKQFDHVKTLGDTTAGSFSDNPTFELPNGWMFSVSVGDYRAPDGKSYEGLGLPPDIALVNTKENLLQGRDITLEKAIDLVK